MWEQYRKTALRMQAMILLTGLAVYFFGAQQLAPALLLVTVMEVGAVLGALWAASLKSRIQSRRDNLPLLRKRVKV